MSQEQSPSPSSPSISADPLPQPQDDAVSAPQNDASPAKNDANGKPPVPYTTRSNRPARACTIRAAARMQAVAAAQPLIERKPKQKRKKGEQKQEEEDEELSPSPQKQCSKIVTPLVAPPEPSQLPRWSIRSMWELASILNFLHVFRPLLNVQVEFSAEEFETALITPSGILSDVHIPLLKAIPPITRMALTRDTWITVLCRKLRDWWHWVADGELPIVASHGAEVEAYNSLDPGVRVLILKALCDIRVEQEDIRSYIDKSLKHGVQLSAFRKERIGGDSHGISYWYEDDPIIGHRLYREIRKWDVVEAKKGKTKGSQVLSHISYLWETVATNLDEFQDVSEKLFSSKNRTEVSLGKKLKNDMLPEIEKIHKRKERLLKKQHREALLLDNFVNVDGITAGRSLRDRKPVTYTFDDYDRSINEAIKVTKHTQPSPELIHKRDAVTRQEGSINGKRTGPVNASQQATFSAPSPPSTDYDNFDDDQKSDPLDRRTRRRQRPQRYSEKDFIEDISDNEEGFDSDDDIVGEVVYDEEYLRKRKQRKTTSSSSEGDEEYRWDDENAEDDEEYEEDSLSLSEDSDKPQKFKKLPGRTRRETKSRRADEVQSGLRRSKRATRNRINYRKYELSESDTESEQVKPEKSSASTEHYGSSESEGSSMGSQDSDRNNHEPEMKVEEPVEGGQPMMVDNIENQPSQQTNSPEQSEVEGVRERHFLDLNELAPGSGFDEGPNSVTKDEDTDDF